MLKTKPSSRTLQRAEISWRQAGMDLKTAQSCVKSQPDKSSLQSAQAAVNALSSVLEAQGFFQLPTFSTNELLDKCVEIEPDFEKLRSPCTILDGNIERDAFGTTRTPHMGFTPAFARACLKACEEIHKATKHYWKANKARFFAP